MMGRRYVVENLDLRCALAAGICQHIEIVQHGFAIGRDSHRAAAFAASACILGPVLSLSEMQAQFVYSRLQWDVVAEIALPAGSIDDGILRARDMLHRALHRGPTREIGIWI